jgi:hypothetical protein
MLLVYYRLYITYTLAGFLFDLDEYYRRNTQKDESLIRNCVIILQKTYNKTKRLKTSAEAVKKYFHGFMVFIDSTERQIPRPTGERDVRRTILEAKRKDVLL